MVLFPRCDTHECVRIQIVNDLILEGDEVFNVSLTPHVPDVEVSPSYARTTVRIYGDADSKLYMIGYKRSPLISLEMWTSHKTTFVTTLHVSVCTWKIIFAEAAIHSLKM